MTGDAGADGVTGRAEAVAAVLRQRVQHQPLWLDVDGQSMGRTISRGRVFVRAGTRPARGQIWAYCASDGRIVVHRVLGSRRGSAGGTRVWLRGDGNPADDPPVPMAHLIGVVVEVDDDRGRRRLGRRDRLAARVVLDARAVVTRVRRSCGRIR